MTTELLEEKTDEQTLDVTHCDIRVRLAEAIRSKHCDRALFLQAHCYKNCTGYDTSCPRHPDYQSG